jgi:hypothetical protein
VPAQTSRWRHAVKKIPYVERGLRSLRRGDEIEALQQRVAELEAAQTGGRTQDQELAAAVAPFLNLVPPGHFYSPIPDMREVLRQADRLWSRSDDLDGLDLNAEAQLEVFKALAQLAKDVTFNVDAQPDRRYFTNNESYGVGDALIAQSFLRLLKPARYLEVGSGWTTALALDTKDRWLDGRLQITCIEPYPQALHALLRPEDELEIIACPVQDVALDRFEELEPGDILFIDCSHVVKVGSDVQFLVTRVLPRVPAGVYVHIHDIFWAFEYPRPWVEEGRAWSELYLVHAFLLFNSEFEIVLFNDWLAYKHHDVMESELPAMTANSGGALWLRRKDPPAS